MVALKENGKFVRRAVLYGISAVMLVGLILIGKVYFNTAKKPIAQMEYFKQYNQSHTIGDYVVSLRYGMYSDETRNGFCIFEVEKENGVVEEPEFFNGNQIKCFGDRISICLLATGTIRSRAVVNKDKLLIYTNFHADDVDSAGMDAYNSHQIFLYRDDKDIGGRYGFKLEDNIGGKAYRISKSTTLYLSYLGVQIVTSNKLDSFKVEAVNAKKRKEVLFDLKLQDGIKGVYSESYSEDEGEETYKYSYAFSDIYDIDNIQQLYVNGEKLN